MKKQTHLVDYNEPIVDNNQKKIFKITIIISFICLIILLLLTVFSLIHWSNMIGYILGSIVGIIVFYLQIKTIKTTHYRNLVAQTKKLFLLNQIIYVVTLIAVYLIFKNVFTFLFTVFGILQIKIVIFIVYLKSKGKKNVESN